MKKEINIKIFVVHHKPGLIYEDDVYVPIQVGKKNAKVDLGIIGDDTGDNISEKNSNYAELTAQYWVWKNYDLNNVDYIGLCHYRRYMAYNYKYNPLRFWNNYNRNHAWYTKIMQSIVYVFGISINEKISKKTIQRTSLSIKKYLNKTDYDVYLPKRTTIRGFHKLGLSNGNLRNMLYDTIVEEYPDYKETIKKFDGIMLRNGCNIGLLKKEVFIEYNERLFNILFKFEGKIKKKSMDKMCLDEPMTAGTRFMGCLGERLFNLFIYHKKLHGLKISHKFNTIKFIDV